MTFLDKRNTIFASKCETGNVGDSTSGVKTSVDEKYTCLTTRGDKAQQSVPGFLVRSHGTNAWHPLSRLRL